MGNSISAGAAAGATSPNSNADAMEKMQADSQAFQVAAQKASNAMTEKNMTTSLIIEQNKTATSLADRVASASSSAARGA